MHLHNPKLPINILQVTSTSFNPDGQDRADQSPLRHPLLALPDEDRDLILELVLQSGSLKGLAEAYGVSYPTIRARLDRVIERLRGAINGAPPDPMNELLARLVEQGQLSFTAARAVRDLHRSMSTPAPPEYAPDNTKKRSEQ